MNDTFLRTIDLPERVNAAVVLDCNGDFNVYVSAKLSHDEQLRAFRHECAHIRREHFLPGLPAAVCEREAKRLTRGKSEKGKGKSE